MASASVPSGASTGAAEALELRDRDAQRYGGLGCRKAVAYIAGEIHQALAGRNFADQAELDRALIELDGTPNKFRLGANAILAVSVAFARACAQERGVPLYQHLAGILELEPGTLPRLTINLLSGGVHAGRQVALQDVLIVPARPTTIDESLAMAYDVYQAAAALVLKRYGMRRLTADEGGLAPPCDSTEELIETAMVAIKAAGYRPGADVALAIDVAASQFYSKGQYYLDGALLDASGMTARLARWGTELHDRFMLPHFIAQDFADVIAEQDAAGYPLRAEWFAPHIEFRFPKYGDFAARGVEVELRQALEPWHVMGEEGLVGATTRYVDSSLERVQVKATGLAPDRYALACNGRRIPLTPTQTQGEFVGAVRYRAWQPPSALHPTIGVHPPHTVDQFDTWMSRSLGGCEYHVMHPGGRNYTTFPVNAFESESRRLARFFRTGHTGGEYSLLPSQPSPDMPFTLDLRRT